MRSVGRSAGAAAACMVASAAEIPRRPAGRSIASTCLVRLRTVICNLLHFDTAGNYHSVCRWSTIFSAVARTDNTTPLVHYLVSSPVRGGDGLASEGF